MLDEAELRAAWERGGKYWLGEFCARVADETGYTKAEVYAEASRYIRGWEQQKRTPRQTSGAAQRQEATGMRERLMQMMDAIELVKAVRNGMRGLDRPSALVAFALSGIAALITGVVTWIVDWLPTWRFANGENPGDYAYSVSSIAETAINSAGAVAGVVSGMATLTLGSFIGGMIAVGFTLLPTIIQFIAPRVVHPVAKTAMDISVGFDFVTDWPSAAMQATFVTTNPIGQFIVTLGLVFIYSLFLQALFVLFLSVFVMSAIVLAAGPPRAARQTVEAY